jgi:hypothetical protein
MPSVEELNRYRLILDTGPLLDAVLNRCVVKYRWESVAPELRMIKNHSDADRLWRFLRQHPQVVIFHGTYVEMEYRRRAIESRTPRERGTPLRASDFWDMVKLELDKIRVVEEAVRLGELRREDLDAFGFVDASLLQLAHPLGGRQAAVLTGDDPLYRACHHRSIKAYKVGDVLSIEV